MSDDADSSAVSAQRLREARTVIGLTQQDTATALDVPRSAVAALEASNRKLSGKELVRLANLYRRPIPWLLGEEPDPMVGDEVTQAVAGLPPESQQTVLAFARFLSHQWPDDPPPRCTRTE